MKLAELKSSLVEQFFDSASSGVTIDKLQEIYSKLRASQGATELLESLGTGSHSNEPSKAFAQFTRERDAVISIIEEDGMQKKAIFSASKRGTQISYMVLTQEAQEVKKSDLKAIKAALRQAKNLNDEVDFHTITL